MLRVLKEVKKLKNVKEIICVDDGSTIDITSDISSIIPQVKHIKLPTNKGKTEAIVAGLEQSSGKYILLLDADLKNVKALEVDAAIQKIEEQSEVDLIILRRVCAALLVKCTRADVLLSGERIIKKSDLISILNTFNPRGFELEIAMNQYMIERNKKVFWMPSSAVNTHKFAKRGFVSGIIQDLRITVQLVSYLGPYNYLRQIFRFGRHELR